MKLDTLVVAVGGCCLSGLVFAHESISKPFVSWSNGISPSTENVFWFVQPGKLTVRDLSLSTGASTLRQWISQAPQFESLPNDESLLQLTDDDEKNWSRIYLDKTGWDNELSSAIESGGRIVLVLPRIGRNSQTGSLTDPSLNDELIKQIKGMIEKSSKESSPLFVYSSSVDSNDEKAPLFSVGKLAATQVNGNGTVATGTKTRLFFQRYTIFNEGTWMILLVAFTMTSVAAFGISWLVSLD